jgi:predicted DNA-binding transcriptional regulator AlpA
LDPISRRWDVADREEGRRAAAGERIDPLDVVQVSYIEGALGVSRSRAHVAAKMDGFPRRVEAGDGSWGWRRAAVDEWLAHRDLPGLKTQLERPPMKHNATGG